MLVVKRKRAASRPVPLGGGSAQVRPATSIDFETAQAAMRRALAALVEGRSIADLYGLSVELPDLADAAGAAAGLGEMIALIELSMLCVERFDDVVFEDKVPVRVAREDLASLLLDVEILTVLKGAMLAHLHERQVEAGKSAPSPAGAAAGAAPTAPDASGRASPAPAASEG